MAANSRGTSPEKRKTTQSQTRKGSGTKSSGTKQASPRPSSKKKKKKKNQVKSVVFREAALYFVMAFSLILLLSNFGIIGKVGRFFCALQFGTFGMLAYIFPVGLFINVVLLAGQRKNRGVVRVKCVTAFFSAAFLCGFIEMITGSYKTMEKLSGYYNFIEPMKKGGGVVGGALCKLLTPAIGTVGAYIVIVVAIITSVVIISERSILGGIKNGGKKVFVSAKEDINEYREETEKKRALRQENRERDREKEREERHSRFVKRVSGVDLSIEIPHEDNRPDGSGPELEDSYRQKEKRSLAAGEVKEVFQNDRYSENILEIAPESSETEDTPVKEIRLEPKTKSRPKPAQRMEPESAYDEPYNEPLSAVHETEPAYAYGEPYSEPSTLVQETESAYGTENYTDGIQAVQEEPEQDYAFDSYEQYEQPSQEENASVRRSEPKSANTARAQTAAQARASVPEKSREQLDTEISNEVMQSEELAQKVEEVYHFPPIELLQKGRSGSGSNKRELQDTAMKLQQTLSNFGVRVTVSDVSCGPAVTRYEIQPEQGVKVSRIVSLADDIKLNLAAADIRIEAPIPGKAAVGIEVPNRETSGVSLRELIESKQFEEASSPIAFGVGKDIAGQVVVADIAKMPHVLIAGATGSGKSVCINTIIMSILYRAKPSEVKMVMIDPKVVELSIYNGIPHLMIPVVTDSKKAAGALNWAVAEMDDRYKKFAQAGVRDLKGYNAKVEQIKDIEDENKPVKLPQIVIIVDELADLMMVSKNEVEDAIVRLAQLARAAGIHLVIATQRPSVDVITGLIKANVPSRIAFAVSSGVDSRTILDMVGAEKLLGKGDMLFSPAGYPKPARVQGAFVSDNEVSAVVEFLKANCSGAGSYHNDVAERINNPAFEESQAFGGGYDEYFAEAGRYLIEKGKGSVSILQRVYRIGFNRAARIMDQLEEAKVMGPEEGTKPRKVLMTLEEFESFLQSIKQ